MIQASSAARDKRALAQEYRDQAEDNRKNDPQANGQSRDDLDRQADALEAEAAAEEHEAREALQACRDGIVRLEKFEVKDKPLRNAGSGAGSAQWVGGGSWPGGDGGSAGTGAPAPNECTEFPATDETDVSTEPPDADLRADWEAPPAPGWREGVTKVGS